MQVRKQDHHQPDGQQDAAPIFVEDTQKQQKAIQV